MSRPLVFSLLIVLFSSLSLSQEELPFWRLKPKLYRSIRDYRRVVVSVDTVAEGRKRKVRVSGVGVVNVPLNYALEQTMRFEVLPEVSSYFKKVVHNRERKEVYFYIRALGQQVRFLKVYKWGKKNNKEAQLDWKVTWGNLKGMVGHYRYRKVAPNKTEFVLWATMERFDIPLPEFLINFTLEVIAEKVAQKMRSFIEENERKSKLENQKNGKKS